MVRAPATSPDEITCANCHTVSPYATATQARAHGWRVAWRPEHNSWCPPCWDGSGIPCPKKAAPAPYDEPLF